MTLKKPYRPRSIIMQLLFALMVAAFLVLVIIAVFLGFFYDTQQAPFTKMSGNYAALLAGKLGVPPDRGKAMEIAEEHDIQIRYENSELRWSTSDDLPAVEQVEQMIKSSGLTHSYSRHQYHVVTNPGGGKFLFRWNIESPEAVHRKFLLGMLILVATVFFLAHVVIWYLLKPLKRLRKGVKQMGEGDLNVQVPVKRNDDLGRLTAAFNDMARNIRGMVKARDQLLVNVSHELRSPITRIKVALEFIAESEKKQRIAADLGEIETMIKEILETERLKNSHGGLALESFNIAELVRTVSLDFKGKPPGITLSHVPAEVFIEIDVERVKMVLQNILENAFKYSGPDGKPVGIFIEEETRGITLGIRDDGIGIPPEEIPHLFEPFYRVDQSRSRKTGGYGLGLSMCKEIMAAHKGNIEIVNNRERGVTVILTFPKREENKSME
ncbi:MAG: HAMP domain-containing histidine kinase [bacterium]|nr:HAMP domain-containing histidine kinase [bacterium]